MGSSPPAEQPKYWFRAKRYGWGWGLPLCWQGWVVMGVWLAVLVPLVVLLEEPERGVLGSLFGIGGILRNPRVTSCRHTEVAGQGKPVSPRVAQDLHQGVGVCPLLGGGRSLLGGELGRHRIHLGFQQAAEPEGFGQVGPQSARGDQRRGVSLPVTGGHLVGLDRRGHRNGDRLRGADLPSEGVSTDRGTLA